MIEVEKLTKYYGSTRALVDVSFEVPAGQIVGFLGPNGAGKTTCMKILTSFISPTHGRASVGGHDVVTDSLAARARTGYLPEDTPLYLDMGVVEYLRYVAELREIPRREHSARVREVIGTCGLTEMAGRVIGTLSKGYRQRVGLAQALIHTPDIVIMDEPTDGLDPNQVVEIRALIREIGKDRTVLLSTHHLAEVEAVCDRVLIIHQGGVVVDQLLAAVGGVRFRVEVASTNGTAPSAFQEAFAALPDVSGVEREEAEGEQTLGFVIDAGDTDIREALFRLAVDKRWVLRELHKTRQDLETVFRQVTTGA